MARLVHEREHRRTTRKALGSFTLRYSTDNKTKEPVIILESEPQYGEGDLPLVERYVLTLEGQELGQITDKGYRGW